MGNILVLQKKMFSFQDSNSSKICIIIITVVITVNKNKPIYNLEKLFHISIHRPGSWDNLWTSFSVWKETAIQTSVTRSRSNGSLSVLLKSNNSLGWFSISFKTPLVSKMQFSHPAKCPVFPFGQISLWILWSLLKSENKVEEARKSTQNMPYCIRGF